MSMPQEIIGLGKDSVKFVWEDESISKIGARDLRINCTCALCVSEATGERTLDPDTVPDDITVTHMELIGNYGVGIHFSDGHRTGIYRFSKVKEAWGGA